MLHALEHGWFEQAWIFFQDGSGSNKTAKKLNENAINRVGLSAIGQVRERA